MGPSVLNDLDDDLFQLGAFDICLPFEEGMCDIELETLGKGKLAEGSNSCKHALRWLKKCPQLLCLPVV